MGAVTFNVNKSLKSKLVRVEAERFFSITVIIIFIVCVECYD